MFHERAQRIAVCRDQNFLPLLDQRQNLALPERQHPRRHVFQAFPARQRRFRHIAIAQVRFWIVRTVELHQRWPRIIAAPPLLNLLLAESLNRLDFILALQISVMPLVQLPMAADRNPHQIHFFKHQPQRLDRPALQRREGEIEMKPLRPQQRARGSRLTHPQLRKRTIAPPGKNIELVGLTLTVADDGEIITRSFGHDVCTCVRFKKNENPTPNQKIRIALPPRAGEGGAGRTSRPVTVCPPKPWRR